ncbi:amidase [SAR202 cluster bacterium AC-409-J13_OGT_754m]|nr:amidase [SAR202 cluster bacterium AC-409-J13_OGT_754m]
MELHELSINQASEQITKGTFSSLDLTEAFLKQISRFEKYLNAWVTIDEKQVIKDAKNLDRELSNHGPRSPIHGIPIGIKDIYYTNGMRTTACSIINSDTIPTFDSTVITKLKNAGAIILGKTVTTEFANADPSGTINPWNSHHTPGGSSSGSAVAVASLMCPAAMGSQTGGSIIRPASYNGVVGLKPTFGRISCYGVIPVSWSLDTLGPITRSVQDAATILELISGYDPKDPSTLLQSNFAEFQFVTEAIKPPQIGVIQNFLDNSEQHVKDHTEKVVTSLSKAGAHIELVTMPKSYEFAESIHSTIMDTETAEYHKDTFKSRPNDYGPKLRERIEKGLRTSATQYSTAQRLRNIYTHDIELLASKWDILLTPSTHSTAPKDLTTTGNPWFQSPWTLSGLPTLTIPSGLSPKTNLPLGIQLITKMFNEQRLISSGLWCEKILNVQITPPLK